MMSEKEVFIRNILSTESTCRAKFRQQLPSSNRQSQDYHLTLQVGLPLECRQRMTVRQVTLRVKNRSTSRSKNLS